MRLLMLDDNEHDASILSNLVAFLESHQELRSLSASSSELQLVAHFHSGIVRA
eukprot:m.365246 g.365246  ORF g.365246 m.365246 type:complete len:53 (-) comp56054_c0_seq3:423-581(-)